MTPQSRNVIFKIIRVSPSKSTLACKSSKVDLRVSTGARLRLYCMDLGAALENGGIPDYMWALSEMDQRELREL